MKFTEWIEIKKNGSDNICPPAMSTSEFENFLVDYLLEENYTITMPLPDSQARTQILHDILMKNSKRYRREHAAWLEWKNK